jgi:hypothetical protein
LSAAVLLATAALAATAQPAQAQVNWTVTGNVTMRIMDYEPWPERNQVCNHSFPITNTGFGQLPRDFWYYGKCGGEIRAEIHYQLSGWHDGAVSLYGVGRVDLFEGTSEDTRDLDGQAHFGNAGVLGPKIFKGSSVTRSFHVFNAMEGERDDKVDLAITWRNVTP